MIAVVWLLVDNLGAAAGAAASTPFFRAIPWIVAGLFALGILGALALKRFRPETYAVLGRIVLDDAQERSEDQPAAV
jgi:hypothetical protein